MAILFPLFSFLFFFWLSYRDDSRPSVNTESGMQERTERNWGRDREKLKRKKYIERKTKPDETREGEGVGRAGERTRKRERERGRRCRDTGREIVEGNEVRTTSPPYQPTNQPVAQPTRQASLCHLVDSLTVQLAPG